MLVNRINFLGPLPRLLSFNSNPVSLFVFEDPLILKWIPLDTFSPPLSDKKGNEPSCRLVVAVDTSLQSAVLINAETEGRLPVLLHEK